MSTLFSNLMNNPILLLRETGIEGTIQGFNCKKVSKKDKGRIKTKVELVPLRSFRHDQKINSSTAVVIDDETRYVAIADVGNILSLYRFAF